MDVLDSKEGSDYIANFDLVPPSPPRSVHDLPDYLYANPDPHPLNHNPHTPSYNGSYFGSPYSQHSELSFSGEDINFDLLSEIAGMDNNTYEPSEYDGPSNAAGGLSSSGNPTNSLLMFTQDSDYMSPHFSPDAVGNTSRRGSPFDHSSPSSNGDPNDMNSALMGAGGGYGNDNGRHSRASSVASNHRSPVHSPSPQPNNNNNSFQPQPSPRMDVAQSFGNMSVHTPNWGTQALPTHSPNMRTHSPLPPPNKAMSPPRLLMPDNSFDGSSSVLGLDIQQGQQQDNLLTAVPKINAPDGGSNSNGADDDMNGGGGGPSFHIVPATPIAGGVGDDHQNPPFPTMATITQGAELGSPDLGAQQRQQQPNQLGVRHSQPPSRQASPYTPPSRLSPAPPSQNQNVGAALGSGSSTSSTGGFVFPDLNQMQQQVSQQHQQQQQGQDDQVRGRRGSDTWTSFDYHQQQQIVQQQAQQQQRQQIHHAQMQAFSFGGAGSSSNNNNNSGNPSASNSNNHFLSPDLGGMRRSISDSLGAPGRGHRLSRSEDIRLPLPGVGGFASNNNPSNNNGPGLGPGGYQPHHGQSNSLSVGGPYADFSGSQTQQSAQFLHPLHYPSSSSGSPLPPIRRSLSPGIPFGVIPPGGGGGGPAGGVSVGHFRRASSGTRSDRGAEVWGSQGVGMGGGGGHLGVAARRVSPYPSPNASPRVRYEELQDEGVQQQQDDGLGMGGGLSQGGGGLGLGLGLGLGGVLSGPGLSLGGSGNGLGGGGGAGQAMGLGHPGLGEIGEPPVSGGFSEEIPITGRGTYANHPSLVNDGASSQGGGRGRAGSANSADNGNTLPLPNNPIKQNVTTGRTANASIRRRKQDANFACTVPGCNSTFTRGFNLKGHLRSHYEQKPYKCHWPGCGKGFARQHDCKRHEQLHSNFRPFECEGCKKQFARMDALNRHLRSEAGGECMRAMAERGVSVGSGAGGSQGQQQMLGQDVGMDDDDDDGGVGYGEDMKSSGFVSSPSPPQQVVVTTRSGRQVPRRRMTGQMDEDAWVAL